MLYRLCEHTGCPQREISLKSDNEHNQDKISLSGLKMAVKNKVIDPSFSLNAPGIFICRTQPFVLP